MLLKLLIVSIRCQIILPMMSTEIYNLLDATDLTPLLGDEDIGDNSTFKYSYNFSAETDDILANFKAGLLTLDQPKTIVLLTLYVPVFLIALVANSLVIYVITRFHQLRRAKNYLVFSLAVADLGVTAVCMPFTVASIVYKLWIYGGVLCKLVWYLQALWVASSIFALTSMSLDRYVAIRHPISSRRLKSKSQVFKMLGAVWTSAAVIMAPILYVRGLHNENQLPEIGSLDFCVEMWPPDGTGKITYSVLLLVLVYAFPCSIVIMCYSMIGRALCTHPLRDAESCMSNYSSNTGSSILQGRRRAARTLIALIIVFILCWLPYNITSLMRDINGEKTGFDLEILPFTLWLGHAHSALNPILYCCFNRHFRWYIAIALKCHHRRRGKSGHQPPRGYVTPTPPRLPPKTNVTEKVELNA